MHGSQAFSSGSVKGVVIVDVSYAAVLELLQELNFGGESLVSFVTSDGRMISVNNPVDSGLIDTAESSSYVKVDGKRRSYGTGKRETEKRWTDGRTFRADKNSPGAGSGNNYRT